MAIAQQITVTGAAGGTILAGESTPGGPRVRLRNAALTTSCYVVGNENFTAGTVNSSNGMILGPQSAVDFTLGGNEALYAISAISTISVAVEVFRTLGQP